MLTRLRQTRYRFADIECIKTRQGAKTEFGDFDSHADAERYQQILQRLFDRT